MENYISIIKINGIYVTGDTNIRTKIRSFQDTLVIRQVNEVADFIKENNNIQECELAPARYIAFNNGVIDLNADTLELQDFTPDKVFVHKLNVDFIIPADVSNNEDNIAFVDKFFHDITAGDIELITLLYELIGYCCYRGCEYHSFYLFSGKGGNGKSTFFQIVKAIVGSSCMSMNLKELTTDKFAPVNLHNMTCNIASDETNLNVLDTR